MFNFIIVYGDVGTRGMYLIPFFSFGNKLQPHILVTTHFCSTTFFKDLIPSFELIFSFFFFFFPNSLARPSIAIVYS